MKKKSPASKNVAYLEHFRSFFAAADCVAVELLIREGVMTDPRIDRDFYYSSLDRLAKVFCEPFDEIDTDDAVHLREHEAKVDAAHMVGLALGMRLRGVDLGLTCGAR